MAKANALQNHMAGTTGTEVAKRAERPQTIAGLLTDPKIKAQMALALPKHVTADRLARIALTEVRKVPKLAQCDQTSFLGAIMQCAALGLEPGGALGHCYLIPFENRRAERTEVQFIIGYRGMLDLARRSGQIVSLTARAVRKGDEFSYRFGVDETINHVPADGDRGAITHVYAIAKLKDGGVQFEVMSIADVHKVRDSSQGYKTAMRYAKPGQPPNTPWTEHEEPMALKTVTRRLFKWLPVSIELQSAIANDELGDAGLPQDNPLVIEGDYSVHDQEEPGDVPTAGDAGLTTQEVHDAIAAATTLDALAESASLIDLTPEAGRAVLSELYEKRERELLKG